MVSVPIVKVIRRRGVNVVPIIGEQGEAGIGCQRPWHAAIFSKPALDQSGRLTYCMVMALTL
jgi:hypothetical protein